MSTTFLVGTSGWNYPHWQGTFYPEGWPKARWLEYYVTQFPALEVNATFYRTFQDQTYHKWRERAPEGFRYVLKVPRFITHRRYLEDVQEPIRRFWGQASLLGERLGLILLQLAPNTPYEPERLRQALEACGDPRQVAVEFRHPRWLTDEALAILRGAGAALCAADSPRERLGERITSQVGYIRLHGRQRWYAYDYSEEELAEIAGVARGMAAQGARAVWVFFNNDFQACAPRNARTLMARLAEDRELPPLAVHAHCE